MDERDGTERVDWHPLSGAEVAGRLATGEHGLTDAEAAERRLTVGPNVLADAPPPTLLRVIVEQFRSPLIYILLIANLITLALGDYLDAGVIAVALAMNAVVGTIQQRKAERSVRSLQQLVSPKADVVRDGHVREIEASELVPGDVVLLESGDRVPADLRLVATTALSIDESLLTGESVPTDKNTDVQPPVTPLGDRHGIAYSGTTVTRGRGRGYVVETGTRTELGRIAETIRTGEAPRSPLQRRIDQFAKVVGVVVLTSATVAFALGLLLGESAEHMFAVAVALAVSAIPESLVVVFTVALAVGVTRMARRQAIVRRLPAVETLGSTSVICSDKTGTLTRNEMTIQEIATAGGSFATASAAGEPFGAEALTAHPELELTLVAGVLISEADAFRDEHGTLVTTGDPTETALLRAAAEVGVEPPQVRDDWPRVAHLPFEPDHRFAAAIVEPGRLRSSATDADGGTHDDGPVRLLVQGAPERVLDMCTHALRDGVVVPLDVHATTATIDAMAARGLRVLAFATREGRVDELTADLEDPHGLVLTGVQAMADPPREGVPEAIAACHEAGMRVVMVTGDHAATAEAIATSIGLRGSGPAITGTELDTLDDEELRRRLPETAVFARVAPEQKLRIVETYRALGEVVAVTGDGVNDAPALQAAHIGIAMGRDGTDVAREASDMVLADDNFVSIRAAVEEGRIAFDNLRKATFFLVSTGAAEIVMVLTALLLGWPLVLLPAQILWLNVVTDGVQDMALAFEPGEDDVLRRPPRRRDEGLISRLLWQRTILSAVVLAAGSLALFGKTIRDGGTVEEARTVAMTTMVLFQAVHVGNSRREHDSAFSSPPWANRFLLAASLTALAVHAAALHFPPTQWLLRAQPLTLTQWATSAVVALSVLVVIEIDKAVRRRSRTPLRLG